MSRKDIGCCVKPACIAGVLQTEPNLRLHFHSLLMDGVFVETGPERELVFLELMAPTPGSWPCTRAAMRPPRRRLRISPGSSTP